MLEKISVLAARIAKDTTIPERTVLLRLRSLVNRRDIPVIGPGPKKIAKKDFWRAYCAVVLMESKFRTPLENVLKREPISEGVDLVFVHPEGTLRMPVPEYYRA